MTIFIKDGMTTQRIKVCRTSNRFCFCCEINKIKYLIKSTSPLNISTAEIFTIADETQASSLGIGYAMFGGSPISHLNWKKKEVQAAPITTSLQLTCNESSKTVFVKILSE